MAEPTLQDILGPNATETATTITLYKADLAANVSTWLTNSGQTTPVDHVGYVPSATNSAESSFMAIIISGSLVLTSDAVNNDTTGDRSVFVEFQSVSLLTPLGDEPPKLAFPFTVQSQQPFTIPALDLGVI